MISKLPNIIFNLEAHLPWSSSEKNTFYRCGEKRNIVNYINRENAVNEANTSTSSVADVCADLNIKESSISDYMAHRPGSTGSFNQDGMLDKDALFDYEEKLRKTGSIIWSSVISFTPEIAATYCKNKEEAQNLIKSHLGKLFDKTDYNIENIDWFGAYHVNTDNPHIHLCFFEKKPLKLKNNQACYNDRFKLPIDNIKNFTADINRSFDPYKFPVYNLRDEIRKEFNLYCKNPVMLLNFTSEKMSEIKKNGHFQYERLNADEKTYVRTFVDEFINLSPAVKKKFVEYSNFLLNFQAHSIKMYKDNNYSTIPKNITSYYDNRMNDFYKRLGNSLLAVLKNYDTLQKDNKANLQKDKRLRKFSSKPALVIAARAQRLKRLAAKKMIDTLMETTTQYIAASLTASEYSQEQEIEK